MYISLKDKKVRAKIQKEFRLTERFSAGRKYILVQVPLWYSGKDFSKITRKLDNWLQKLEQYNPGFLNRYIIKDYFVENSIEIMNLALVLQFKKEDRKTISGKLEGTTLNLKTPLDPDPEFIRKGVIGTLKKVFKETIDHEVLSINEDTIKGTIKSIKLKDNFSNWGSCSNTGNINLSVRLMLLPYEVRKYVIIHELCHLVELNHSRRFWNLVEKHCPDFRDHERWLKLNGNHYYI